MGRVAAGAQWPWGRALALLLVAAGGCGHAATPAQPPAAAALANRQDPFSATLAWWPSQLPDSPSVWLHVKAPAVDLPRLAKLAPPAADRDLRDPARLATMVLGSEIAGLIDLQGPLDLLTSSAPAPLFTLAFSVSSPEVVKDAAAAGWLRPLGPARWALSPPGGGRPGMSCQVWHLATPVGFRILCSNDAGALNRDGPLLLGRLAKRSIAARVRIEILEPFLAAYWARETTRVSAGRSDYDAGQRLGTELTKELFDGASLAVSTNLADPDLDLVIEVAYRNLARSPILAAWLRSSASPPPLPPELWRLPADSRIALAFAGTDSRTATETFESLFSRFVEGFRSSSSSTPASEAEVQSVFDSIRDVLPNQGRSVIALGPPPAGPATGAHQLVGDVTGWLILGGATDSATIRARVGRILAAQRGASAASARPLRVTANARRRRRHRETGARSRPRRRSRPACRRGVSCGSARPPRRAPGSPGRRPRALVS